MAAKRKRARKTALDKSIMRAWRNAKKAHGRLTRQFPAVSILKTVAFRTDDPWRITQIDDALRGLEFAIIWLRKERLELEQMQREAGRKKLRKTLRKVKR